MGRPDRAFSLYRRPRKSGKPTYYCRLLRRLPYSRAVGRRKLSELSTDLLEEHFLKMYEAAELAARTVNGIMTVLRAMLREAHRSLDKLQDTIHFVQKSFIM